jgi:hypothetical protein
MTAYYDRQGNPITRDRYIELFEDRTYKRVEFTDLGDYRVSTVWLGLNHNFGDGEPLIFETMVFHKDKGWEDQDMDRYPTEAEALEGHRQMVERWRQGSRAKSGFGEPPAYQDMVG